MKPYAVFIIKFTIYKLSIIIKFVCAPFGVIGELYGIFEFDPFMCLTSTIVIIILFFFGMKKRRACVRLRVWLWCAKSSCSSFKWNSTFYRIRKWKCSRGFRQKIECKFKMNFIDTTILRQFMATAAAAANKKVYVHKCFNFGHVYSISFFCCSR